MIDPDDLNVESYADYDRFTKLAEQRELEFDKDYTIARDCCMIYEGLTDWEVEFVDHVFRSLKEQREIGPIIGLSPAQRRRLERILEERA